MKLHLIYPLAPPIEQTHTDKPRTLSKVLGRYFDASLHPCYASPALRNEAGKEQGFKGCGVKKKGKVLSIFLPLLYNIRCEGEGDLFQNDFKQNGHPQF